MTKIVYRQEPLLKELGDGLILRQANPADAERLATFNASIHGHEGTDEPDQRVGVWTRDLLLHPHPTVRPSDFTLVEDTRKGSIVSSMVLISQTWSYSGQVIKVGRPELVGTHSSYRERGLIRSQFEVIHQWSKQRGELLQAITGIPYYYRLFGYEMALDLGGGRAGYHPHVPELKEGEEEPYQIRPAGENDIPFLAHVDSYGNKRYLVSCVRDEKMWQYELSGRSSGNVNNSEIRIIEDKNKNAIGFLVHPADRWGSMMPLTRYEISSGQSWESVTSSVIRYLWTAGESAVSESGEDKIVESFGFWLGREHPLYTVIPDKLPRVKKPYAWYLRVPDLPGFIRHIAPVLERRLAASPFVGHSGELKLTLYRQGLRLKFDAGRLETVEHWQPEPTRHSGDAGFPGLVFTQLVFGYRSMADLQYAFADCWTKNDQVNGLLNVLFPRQVSDVWPLS